MKRKISPLHDKWHKRVEGQIRDCIFHHPNWFNFKNERIKNTCINSLAKRIVGEIIADGILGGNKKTRCPSVASLKKKIILASRSLLFSKKK